MQPNESPGNSRFTPVNAGPTDAGLWKRGIALFVLVAIIAGTALFVALYRPSTISQADGAPTEYLITMLGTPMASFPGTLAWGVLPAFAENLPSAPGWEIRYNATLALARRGSPDLPKRADILAEMLDEEQQLKNFRVMLGNGQIVSDEVAARRTVLDALAAFLEWHKKTETARNSKTGNADLQNLYEAIVRLQNSTNNVLKAEAVKASDMLQLN